MVWRQASAAHSPVALLGLSGCNCGGGGADPHGPPSGLTFRHFPLTSRFRFRGRAGAQCDEILCGDPCGNVASGSRRDPCSDAAGQAPPCGGASCIGPGSAAQGPRSPVAAATKCRASPADSAAAAERADDPQPPAWLVTVRVCGPIGLVATTGMNEWAQRSQPTAAAADRWRESTSLHPNAIAIAAYYPHTATDFPSTSRASSASSRAPEPAKAWICPNELSSHRPTNPRKSIP